MLDHEEYNRRYEFIKTKLVNSEIPIHMQSGVLLFVMQGLKPGHFLQAVFANNLMDAFSYADGFNIKALDAYAKFIFTYCPEDCWGSYGKVRSWNGLEALLK